MTREILDSGNLKIARWRTKMSPLETGKGTFEITTDSVQDKNYVHVVVNP